MRLLRLVIFLLKKKNSLLNQVSPNFKSILTA